MILLPATSAVNKKRYGCSIGSCGFFSLGSTAGYEPGRLNTVTARGARPQGPDPGRNADYAGRRQTVTSAGDDREIRRLGNYLLLTLIVVSVFIVPAVPAFTESPMPELLLMAIFLVTSLTMRRRRGLIMTLAVASIIIEAISSHYEFAVLRALSRLVPVILFSLVVFGLVRQVARASKVTGHVILEAINGYLLVGLFFAMIAQGIVNLDRGALTLGAAGGGNTWGNITYFTFVTFTTLGYGDVVPLKPYMKSLAALTGIAGQIYIAVIIALLVGKFASAGKAGNGD
jgi:hypothetical protein